MKLTNTMRDAFVSAVMADVPQTDYREKTRQTLVIAAFKIMPPLVREASKKHPEWFAHWQQLVPSPDDPSVCVIGPYPLPVRASCLPKEALQKAWEYHKAAEQQAQERDWLMRRLREVADRCNTRKALAEALPEFEKYLPAEYERPHTMPAAAVHAELVADFVKAGWPLDSNNATK